MNALKRGKIKFIFVRLNMTHPLVNWMSLLKMENNSKKGENRQKCIFSIFVSIFRPTEVNSSYYFEKASNAIFQTDDTVKNVLSFGKFLGCRLQPILKRLQYNKLRLYRRTLRVNATLKS